MTDISDPFRDRAAAVAQNLEAEARAGALTDIGRAAIVLLVMAVLNIALSTFHWYRGGSPPSLIDGVFALGSALALRTYHSRFLALALLLLPLATLALLFLDHGAAQVLPQKSGLLSIVAAFFAVRGTFRLASIEGTRLVWKAIALNFLSFVVYEVIALAIALFAIGSLIPDAAEPTEANFVGTIVYTVFFAVLTLVCLQYLPFTRRATSISTNLVPAA